MNSKFKPIIILTLITCIVTSLVTIVYNYTNDIKDETNIKE